MRRLRTLTSTSHRTPRRGFGLGGSFGPRPLLFGLLLLAFGLAGCSANIGADPLLAARVNGRPITLAQYDSMLAFTQASAALHGASGDLQSVSGRENLTANAQSAFTWLINLELTREQLAAQKLHVTAAEQKGGQATVDSYTAQVRQQLDQQPDNAQLRALLASLTPDVKQIIADRIAGEQALADQGKFPTAHVRAIYVLTQDDATNLLKQVQQGADFGQLAHDHSMDTDSAAKYGDLGTVYVGEISPQFSQQVFTPIARGQTPQKYIIAPVGTRFGLFEVTQPGMTAIPQDQRQQLGPQVAEDWLSTIVQPQAHIDQYVTVQ